jgi:hypothetical protein
MQIVLDSSDFSRLTDAAKKEVLALLSGGAGAAPKAAVRKETPGLRWREPVSLDSEQVAKLLHGLSGKQKEILSAFANGKGRVSMKQLAKITGDKHLSTISQFQNQVTRKLRRIIDDPDKKAQVFAWDFDKTKWDDRKTTIVDGEYFVSPATAQALRQVLKG